jgi:hypothetical protein
MKVSFTYAARMMLVLLFSCLMMDTVPLRAAADACCERIQNVQVTPLADGQCCFKVSGTIGRNNDCFRWWQYEELIGGTWVNDGVFYMFNPNGDFSITKCGPGTHIIRLLFLDAAGNVRCRKELQYNCDETSCCDRIDGPYINTYYNSDGKCCFTIKGSVGPNWQNCFKAWEYQEFINGTWVSSGGANTFSDDGTFITERCVGAGIHTIRIVFYGPDGSIVCTKELQYNCESDCCKRILGPYIYPLDERCCFELRGSVGEGWQNCFKYWEWEEYVNGTWVSDGVQYGFNPDGTYNMTKCVPYGSHQFRLVFYDYNGHPICVKEFNYDCADDCCERIQGPYILTTTATDADAAAGYECCFVIKGSVGEEWERCFKWIEYQELINGAWIGDGVQYGFNPDGTFYINKCVSPGTHTIRLLFYGPNGEVICVKELTYTCENNCCETIQGPFISPAPILPPPGQCCFVINGTVGQNNRCFKYWQYQEFVGGTWVGDGNNYLFNPDGSFSVTKCVGYGVHQIRILFYNSQGEVICVKELRYECKAECCETIKGPFIYPATIQEDGRCCFTIKGSIGEGNTCFEKWEYQELIGGAWISDGTYTFNPDGTFEVTKCRPYGTHVIRILFYDVAGRVLCVKELKYTCAQPCCERIDGPHIFPALNPEPGQCCFTIKGSVGENWQDCFRYWQYEELIGGVWVNDLVNYSFNGDGTFSITKCRPYGNHQIRILFYDMNGNVICVRYLEYNCPKPCCERIDGPYIFPASDAEPGKCCYTIKGSVGEGWQECFRYWQYEELIGGVWVNDLVNYSFNGDGSFSITKCRPFGTHQIRILFYDGNGKVICVKELTYTCENECCNTIDGPYIFPSANPEPDRCCFTIKGSIGECNPCFKYWQYEELINGAWVNDGISYFFNADGSFTITKCRPYGTHLVRILFYDYNGNVICVKELSYTCEPPIDCCERIQGLFIQTVSSRPGRCCFTINGSVGPNWQNCFQSFEIERWVGGVWVNDLVSYVFNADGSFSVLKCVPNGIHLFRVIFRGPHGQIICIKEFKYHCDYDCCETISGPFVALISSQGNRCCWRIDGSIGRDNACFQSWEFERWNGTSWVNDAVSYIFNPDGSFGTVKCYPSGSHLVRIIFRGFNGEILCIKEFTLTCRNNCCETIQGPVAQLISSSLNKCCWKISGSIDRSTECFRNWEFERLVNGVWVNDAVSYIFQPDGSFSITKCFPSGTHQIRILFRDFSGRVICTKELTLSCNNSCCELIQGPWVYPAGQQGDMCCFTIKGQVPPHNECFHHWEFERLVNGVWVNDLMSYLFNPDGSFSITKCFPIYASPFTMRIIFRNYAGDIICIREFQYNCTAVGNPTTKQGEPGEANRNASGLIREMTAVPNPASEHFTISYDLSEAAPVSLLLYNAAGEKVAVLEDGAKNAGRQTVEYSAGNLASGTYYARLVVNGSAVDVPIVIIR